MNTRMKDVAWCPGDEKGQAPNWERVSIAVLLDIRDRLDVLRCPNFQDIPHRLSRLEEQLKLIRKERRRSHKKAAHR